jgi:hypothetical protein
MKQIQMFVQNKVTVLHLMDVHVTLDTLEPIVNSQFVLEIKDTVLQGTLVNVLLDSLEKNVKNTLVLV